MKREAAIAGLASEGLALISGSAGAGSNAVVGTTPADPVEFRKCARDLKASSAVKKHTVEERGGGRDPGVRRPGADRGQLPARFDPRPMLWWKLFVVTALLPDSIHTSPPLYPTLIIPNTSTNYL